MRKINYYECSQKIIKPRARFLHEINCYKLFLLNNCPKEFEDEKQRAFSRLLYEGLLSEKEKGNYFVSSPLFPNFKLNPNLEGQKLFFTLRLDASSYKDKFRKPTFKLSGDIGSYVVPDEPTGVDWKIIRLKHFKEYRHKDLLEQLMNKNLISLKKKGNFSVVQRVGSAHGRRYLNLEYFSSSERYYFTRRKDVQNIFKTYGEKDLEINH